MLENNQIAARTAPPLDLASVDCYKVILKRQAVFAGNEIDFTTGSFSGSAIVSGTFTDIPQPSEGIHGKRLSIRIDATNILPDPLNNQITINGISYGGVTSESFSFTESTVIETVQFWKSVSSIVISFASDDINYPAGSISILESVTITAPENGGDYAELVSYENGVFSFKYAGTDDDFILQPAYYLLDYPSPISVEMGAKGKLIIGSDLTGKLNGDAIIESPVFYSQALTDVRAGEYNSSISQTSLHLSPRRPLALPSTTCLLNLDNTVVQKAAIHPVFEQQFKTSPDSVNQSFEDSLYVDEPVKLDNARQLVAPKAGTVEFFLSPMLDTYHYNDKYRFIFDATSLKTIDVFSTTSTTIILPFKVRSVNRIYLKGDRARTNILGTKNVLADSRTIRLPGRLPTQRTAVTIEYTPINFSGDRISLYIDPDNNLNFAITASNNTRVISRAIEWNRNTWHRVMLTWNASNPNNTDQMRMFVDGIENNIITWGSPGFIWGGGHVWGTSSTATIGSQALIDDINLVDEFSAVNLGSDFSGSNTYMMRLDNLRFSSIAREPARIGAYDYDLAWNNNIETISPLASDAYTKGVFNFDRSEAESDFLSNLLSNEAALFSIGVEIDDGFNKILSSERNKEALLGLYQRLKPGHMRLFSKFKQEE